jgi:hypothetical protein
VKAVERGAPAAAILAALSALACCLPVGIIGPWNWQASVSGLHHFVRGCSASPSSCSSWVSGKSTGEEISATFGVVASVALFWVAVVVVLFVTVFPQLIANWLAG